MPHWVIALFARYGYFALFIGVFLENAGIPIPGETVLLAAGFLARQHALRLAWVIPCAAVAAMFGDNVGYWIGRRGGRPFVERRGKYIGLTRTRLQSVDVWFRDHGPRTIFFARFISGLRVVAALSAGISHVPWRTFLFYNAAGAICWAVVIGTLGYLFGQSWHLLERWVGGAGLLLIGLIAVIVLFALLRRGRGRIAEWLPRRMTLQEGWLIAVSLIATGLLGKIVEDVAEHESTLFDVLVSSWILRLSFPAVHAVMTAINALGSAWVVATAALAAVAWQWHRGESARALVVATVTLLALGLESSLRAIHPVRASGSFPAGETMNVVAVYGVIGLMLIRDRPRLRAPLVLAVTTISLLVGVAGVFLELQWPTDALAGYCAGLLLVVMAAFWTERLDPADEST